MNFVPPLKGLTPFETGSIPAGKLEDQINFLFMLWSDGRLADIFPELADAQSMPEVMAKSEIRKTVELTASDEIYLNNLYQVNVRRATPVVARHWPPMIHLSVKRRDKQPIRDWRHMQWIKNTLIGPENEGVELYPAESRLVDTANQFHMWVISEPDSRFPFGFANRTVTSLQGGGSVQRPIE